MLPSKSPQARGAAEWDPDPHAKPGNTCSVAFLVVESGLDQRFSNKACPSLPVSSSARCHMTLPGSVPAFPPCRVRLIWGKLESLQKGFLLSWAAPSTGYSHGEAPRAVAMHSMERDSVGRRASALPARSANKQTRGLATAVPLCLAGSSMMRASSAETGTSLSLACPDAREDEHGHQRSQSGAGPDDLMMTRFWLFPDPRQIGRLQL